MLDNDFYNSVTIFEVIENYLERMILLNIDLFNIQ